MKLAITDRQKLFADYYIGEGNLNATRSAKLAGYKGDENALAVQGSRNLRIPKIRDYIENQLKDLALSRSEVLAILTKHAKGSLADVLDSSGRFDLGDAKKRGVDGLIKKLKISQTKEGTTHEYEVYDAQTAAVHLGKVYAMWTDKSEVSGPNGGPLEFATRVILPELTDEEIDQLPAADRSRLLLSK